MVKLSLQGTQDETTTDTIAKIFVWFPHLVALYVFFAAFASEERAKEWNELAKDFGNVPGIKLTSGMLHIVLLSKTMHFSYRLVATNLHSATLRMHIVAYAIL